MRVYSHSQKNGKQPFTQCGNYRKAYKRIEGHYHTIGQERETLEKEIAEIRSAVERYEDGNGRAERFMKLVECYTDFEEIAPVTCRVKCLFCAGS